MITHQSSLGSARGDGAFPERALASWPVRAARDWNCEPRLGSRRARSRADSGPESGWEALVGRHGVRVIDMAPLQIEGGSAIGLSATDA